MNKRTALTAAAIVAVGCIAIPTGAYAANGGPWLLGRSNSETATTTVTNTYGTPLSLVAKSGYAPLKVNSNKVVTYLNADLVDGYSATSFAMRSAKAGVVNDKDLTDAYGARCPTGTIATGGGGYDPMGWGLVYSGPDWDNDTNAIIPNSWIALDGGGYVLSSYVNCVSLSGAAVPGAMTGTDYFDYATAAPPASQQGTPQAAPERNPATKKR